jgi:hypothetical protein
MIATFPQLLPDEHLFSAVTRFHLLSGNRTQIATRNQLGIGKGPLKSQNILTESFHSTLHSISNITGISQKIIAYENTIIPIFKISLPISILSDWNEKWAKNQSPVIPRQRWENDKVLIFDNSWKYCPKCIESDRDIFGISYWHTIHQIPTLNNCHIHLNQSLKGRCHVCNHNSSTLDKMYLPDHTCKCQITYQSEIQKNWDKELLQMYMNLKLNVSVHSAITKERIIEFWKLYINNSGSLDEAMDCIKRDFEDYYTTSFLSRIFGFYSDKLPESMKTTRPNIAQVTLNQCFDSMRHPVYYFILMKMGSFQFCY